MFIPAAELTHQTIAQQLALGMAAIEAGQTCFEFSQTRQVDSSTVACLLAWKRHAQQRGGQLEYQHLPANLTKLIALYGVAQLVMQEVQ